MAKLIGIVGGIGSYAGIDLIRKIYDNTGVKKDQEHLPVAMLSIPGKILDRTEYLEGKVSENPGYAIAKIITKLSLMDVEVVGIPCNTAHAPKIYDVVKNNIPSTIKLLHIAEETGRYLTQNHPAIKKIGVLGTNGTFLSRIYPKTLFNYNIEAIYPQEEIQKKLVHPAVYNLEYGIKAFSSPVNEKARTNLMAAARHLLEQGVEAIVLACTEIPLAIQEREIENTFVIDATEVLAMALIRESTKE